MQGLSYPLDTTWRTLLHDLGLDTPRILRHAGLPTDLLARPTARLTPAAFYRLWGAIEAVAADPLLPLRLSLELRIEALPFPLAAALYSADLRTAVERVARFKRLVAPVRLEVTSPGGALALEMVWLDGPGPPPGALVLLDLLFAVAFARLGTRERVRPSEVVLPEPPAQATSLEEFLGLRIARGPRPRVVFTPVDAARALVTANDSLWAALEPELHRRLAALDTPDSTVHRVRATLRETPGGATMGVAAVARRLAVGTRTLQRRIGAEGTSFQHLRHEARAELARHYLATTTLPVAEIAELLGFTEPTSFYRAFRAWTGSTPERLRRLPEGAPPSAANLQE